MNLQPPTQNTAVSTAEPLPAHVEAALWRGGELRPPPTTIHPSGWAALDFELPGGGWPGMSITELLVSQPGVLEWRLLTPALRPIVAAGGEIAVVAPERPPAMAGLVQDGIDPDRFWRYVVKEPARRLWTTEQLLKGNGCDVLIAWLPQVRQEQLRRLQACAQGFEGLCFLIRPAHAMKDSSPAPLRISAALADDWDLRVRVAKRRGPVHDQDLLLPAFSGGVERVLTPALRYPSQLDDRPILPIEVPNALGSTQASARSRNPATH
jgi:protein ImuA